MDTRLRAIILIMQCIQGKRSFIHESEDLSEQGFIFQDRRDICELLDQSSYLKRRINDRRGNVWDVWDYVGPKSHEY